MGCPKRRFYTTLLAATALALAACEGSYVTDPDGFPDDNSIALVTVSVASGSTIEVGDHVGVLVRYRARQRSDIQVRLLDGSSVDGSSIGGSSVDGSSSLGESPAVRLGPGRGEETLVVTADRAGEVELIEVALGDPGFDRRIFDLQQVPCRLTVR